MASKPPSISPESAGANALAQYPPTISLSNKLLSSALTLPPNPAFAYAVFSPTSPSPLQVDTVELARRQVLKLKKPSVLDSVLCSVLVDKDVQHLYVFIIDSGSAIEASRATLESMQFDGLSLTQSSTFTPVELYPCSPTCSTQRCPCPTCLNPSSFPPMLTYPTDPIHHCASFIPREPLRIPHAQLLQAVRDRLTEDICSASRNDSRRLSRLRDGFLIFPQSTSPDWGIGWEHHAQNRPLIHTYLHLTLSSSRILVQPLLRPTHYLPVTATHPLPAGTPIVLLPYGTPAYYLTSYTGSTSSLTAQFSQSLSGLGCGSWASSSTPSTLYPLQAPCSSQNSSEPTYLIAWINVQNKNGEEKGVSVIWPASLALSYLPTSPSPHARTSLVPLPDLPVQLQPSPPPPEAPAPLSLTGITQSIVGQETATQPLTLQPALTRRTRPHIAPGPSALRALRTLCLSSDAPVCSDVRTVATEVGGYVDAIAKERERERERLKREREGVIASTTASPARASTTVITTAVDTPGSVELPSPLSGSLFGPDSSPIVPAPEIPIASTQVSVSQLQGPPQFYPSPSQSRVISGPQSAGELPTPISAMPAPLEMQIPSNSDGATPQPNQVPGPSTFVAAPETTFDTFGFDDWGQSSTAWQSSTDFISSMALDDVPMPGMAMDINLNAGLNYGADPVSGGGSGWGSGDMTRMDVDGTGMDDIFTDADFDFWDTKPTPVLPSSRQAPMDMGSGSGLTPTAGPTLLEVPSPLYHEPIQVDSTSGESPWVPSALAEGFVQRSNGGIDLAPELLPPSPSKTASSQSTPSTPIATVHVAPEARVQLHSPVAPSSRVFDPIPFASVHRIADGKYTAGKFALPSPPDEEDRTHPIPLLSTVTQMQSGRNGLWRRYNAATDPRIGVVRKLIGVKRKSFQQGERDPKASAPSSWSRASDDWARDVVQTPPPDDSEPESEEDEEDEAGIDDAPSPSGVRPTTPPPSYLPLGPTLLHTYFHHSQLLPLSTPLKPPGAVSPPSLPSGAPPVSVPTPVSPAALLGAASEKSKSLEAAAHILAREVVESAVWGDAWRANAGEYWTECRSTTEVWQADVKRVVRAFEAVPALEAPLDIQSVYETVHPTTGEVAVPTLEMLDSPMFSVGKSDAIIQVLPTALRFWEKLGLTPRAGKKDVVAFVFFEDADDGRQDEAEKWLQHVSRTYMSNNLGSHVAGRSSSCSRDGLVPLKFESFRKTLATFVSSLPASASSYVFYIATPAATISLSSPVLRQVFSAVKRAQKTYSEAQILFQFVPAHLIHSHKCASGDRWGMLPFVCSVYDRILRPVDRVMSRRFFEHGERIRNFFQEPAFTIARPQYNKVHLVRQYPALTLDVMERHSLLHVGYRISSCGKWILATCVDQRGEAHDMGVWMVQSDSQETQLAQQLWTFALNFAKKASVEWRVVFAKLGSMGTTELDAWIHFLDSLAPVCRELPMVHISLLSVEVDASWTFIAPPSVAKGPTSPNRASKPSAGTFLADISSSTYCLTHDPAIDLLSACPQANNIEPCHPYIPDLSDLPASPINIHHLRPVRTTTLIRSPCSSDYTAISMLHLHQLHAVKSPRSTMSLPDDQTLQDIARNYQELTVLAQARWLKANPILPFHLGALEVVDMALSGSLAPEL